MGDLWHLQDSIWRGVDEPLLLKAVLYRNLKNRGLQLLTLGLFLDLGCLEHPQGADV